MAQGIETPDLKHSVLPLLVELVGEVLQHGATDDAERVCGHRWRILPEDPPPPPLLQPPDRRIGRTPTPRTTKPEPTLTRRTGQAPRR